MDILTEHELSGERSRTVHTQNYDFIVNINPAKAKRVSELLAVFENGLPLDWKRYTRSDGLLYVDNDISPTYIARVKRRADSFYLTQARQPGISGDTKALFRGFNSVL